jgi:hypothetical protein
MISSGLWRFPHCGPPCCQKRYFRVDQFEGGGSRARLAIDFENRSCPAGASPQLDSRRIGRLRAGRMHGDWNSDGGAIQRGARPDGRNPTFGPGIASYVRRKFDRATGLWASNFKLRQHFAPSVSPDVSLRRRRTRDQRRRGRSNVTKPLWRRRQFEDDTSSPSRILRHRPGSYQRPRARNRGPLAGTALRLRQGVALVR